MESISGYESSKQSKASTHASGTHVRKEINPSISPAVSTSNSSVSLTDFSSLGERAAASGPDIREDKIAYAQRLMNDPNWLNDDTLDSLAERLIDSEGF